DADLGQQLDRAIAALPPRAAFMRRQRLHDLEADVEAWVEAGHRLLEDHGDVLADDLAPGAGRETEQVLALEAHLVGENLARIGNEPHDRQHGDALAGAGFADHAQELAFLDGEVDAIDRAERPAMGLELDREIADFQQRHCSRPSALQLRVERIAQPVAEQVEGQHRHQDGETGESHDPIGAVDILPRIGQHGAPFRSRRLGAEAEEAERRRIQHRRGDAEGRLHDQRRQAVRQHGLEHEPERTGGHARGDDIVLGELAHHRGAGEPRIMRDVGDGNRDHRIGQPGAEQHHDDDRQQQAGQRQDDVHQTHDQGVDRATVKAGKEAEQDAAGQRQGHDDQADHQREPRTVDQARKDVAAEAVSAEHIRPGTALVPGRRLQGDIDVLGGEVMRRQQRRADRDEDQQDDQGQRRHG
ncbi:hypothetical protein BVRB_018640, partial [Beta vulgaris subsp. vulgaris]